MNNPSNKAIASDRDLPLRGVRILLVEDEPDIADLFTLILASAGATVMIVSHSEEALLLLRYMRSDILISNVRLPDHNGDWLVRQVRSHETPKIRHMPAIAITSYMRDVCEEKILAAGFEHFMPKIADPDELIAAVRRLIHERKHEHEESHKN